MLDTKSQKYDNMLKVRCNKERNRRRDRKREQEEG